MKASAEEYTTLLSDVRKSYRLLHDYQKLVMNSLKYISTELDIPFRGGWSKFSNPQPRSGAGSLTNFAWDWLGMYHYEFRFDYRSGNHRGINVENKNFVTLCAILINDSGFYENQDANRNKENLQTFQPVEESKSKMLFLLFDGPWKPPRQLIENNLVKQLVAPNADWPKDLAEDNIHGFCCEVSELFEQESTDRIVSRILASAKTHGVPLYRRGESPYEIASKANE
ncbi:hypothetical protein [Roseibacillus persicicus]|uniref:Uncharacterized protein n=1 Tax=Roseibacillus persicicus TaxID=454148 RepID=A0A918TNP5_9BACT|nr:hypothetical protein [Roseibacillus persicicus]GHC52964.1 hypothetical protein GCM10007100_19210 [Roseibacillus persicicus]